MARLTGSSIVKISLLVFLMLVLFAAAGLGSCSGRWWSTNNNYSNIGNAEVNASEVDSFDIDWAAGEVKVEVYDGSMITLTEEAAGVGRAQSMRWEVDGKTLKIDYGNWTSCFAVHDKRLTVRIPKDLAKSINNFKIDGASGEYNVSDLICRNFTINLASGKLNANTVDANEVKLEAASGSLSYSGTINDSLKIDVASGTIDAVLNKRCPKEIDTDMASGKVTIALPPNDGFTAKVNYLSGSFDSDFDLLKSGNDLYTYKQGGNCEIKADMTSGKFMLKQS